MNHKVSQYLALGYFPLHDHSCIEDTKLNIREFFKTDFWQIWQEIPDCVKLE